MILSNRKGGTVNIPQIVKFKKKSPPTVNCGGGVLDCLLLFQLKKVIIVFTPNPIYKFFRYDQQKKTAKDYFTSSDAARKTRPVVGRY